MVLRMTYLIIEIDTKKIWRHFITTHYDIIILFVQDLHVICLDVHEICHGDV